MRVAGAALAALAAALAVGGRVFEPHLDRLMTPLFLRAADQKVRPRHPTQQADVNGLTPFCGSTVGWTPSSSSLDPRDVSGLYIH